MDKTHARELWEATKDNPLGGNERKIHLYLEWHNPFTNGAHETNEGEWRCGRKEQEFYRCNYFITSPQSYLESTSVLPYLPSTISSRPKK